MISNLKDISRNKSEVEVKKLKRSDSDVRGRSDESEKAYDTALFARFQSGDDQAFLELFDRHANRIGRYCYRMIGDRERAQDVAQDVWEKIIKLRGESEYELRNPLGLLYTIARNLSLNHIRDQRDHISLQSLGDDEHPPIETQEFSRLEEMVIIALQKLPLAQREILILHSYSGYTFEEIGEMIGEKHGGVRTKAWRARQQLKRIIAALIEFEENQGDKSL
ncbi:MAG: RNA polymerase sigma factor [Ignavibacteriae bacterium]|nr:RNA polymerase sigma factor [Ignavibacteriota bacterium]MCB9214858.1 RNA polymerase sigma factor [Ignavibacteria bacterium]